MRTHRLEYLTALLLVLSPAAPVRAQVREVVSSRIAVSGHDATLHLAFTGGDSLDVSFQGGEVRLNGSDIGSYTPGGPLESSWRTLLGDAVSLDDGRLASALVDWSPPTSLQGDARALGRRIDRALEDGLTPPAARTAQAPSPPVQADTGAGTTPQSGDLAALLRHTDQLPVLAQALKGLSLNRVQVHVGEDVDVGEGQEVNATLVVVDGDLDVRGTVDGDAVVTGGSVTIHEGGRITGDVRLADAKVVRNDGTVGGTVESVDVGADRGAGSPDVKELRDQIRDQIRSEMRGRSRGPSVFSPLRHVGRGLAGLLQNLVSFAVVVVLGMLTIRFFPEHLDRVTEAARRSPGRSAVVGVAGFFLLAPAYILGIVALAISIVGIPALLAWIPLFPVAAFLAAAVGYLAAARILGEWIAEQGVASLRPSNSLHTVAAGLGALFLPFAAAHVVQMAGPWLGFIQGLFVAVGWIAAVAACSIGFGAVLLTRGGRQPAYPNHGPDDDGWTPPPPPHPAGGQPTGGTPPPAEPHPEQEEEWTAEWEELERSARRRTAESGAAEPGPGEPGPSESGSASAHAPEAEEGEGDDEGTKAAGGDGDDETSGDA